VLVNINEAVKSIESREVYRLMRKTLEDNYPDFDRTNEFLELCELYKIITPSALINELNKENLDEPVVSMEREFISSRFHDVYDRLHSYGFYVYHYDEVGRVVTVATSIDNIDCPNIDLLFADLKVERVVLTPLNFRRISEPSTVENLIYPSIIYLRIIAEGVLRNATDIRFSAFNLAGGKKTFPIRFRVGNELVDCNLFRLDEKTNIEIMKSVLAEKSIYLESQLSEPGGALFPISNPFGVDNYELRVQMNSTNAGYLCNTRIIKMRTIDGTSNSLGFDDRINEVIGAMTRVQNGLCLVTGAQRSGKTTTLLAIFNEICKKPISIAEISNPVESPLPLDPLSYSNIDELLDLCSSCKKLDLDVALVNEVPDRRVADAIYDLVNSSIGLFTTMHINRIWHLCYKLSEYFGDKMMNTISYLRYVLNQKSFIKQCPHCRETRIFDESSSDLYPEVKELCVSLGITSYSESKGCVKCEGKGVMPGIQPYVEYIVFDDKFKSELSKCSTLYEMELKIRDKVNEDKTSLEYFVLKSIKDGDIHPNELINLL